MTQRLAAGIDVGGTNTKFGLVDQTGKIVFRDHVDTPDFAEPKDLAGALSKRIRAALNGAELAGIGIGAPNGNFFNGSIQHAPNLAWKGIVPLARFFEEHAGVRALLTNDANAAALGEMLFGAARGMRDFIFITLGTGVGSGIVVNGALVYGHDGLAGEIGHVIVEPAGRPCGCGRRGCLEQYASAGGLVATYRERTGDRETPVTAREIAERAQAGEAAAVEAFRETGDLLGLTLANSVAYTSPAAIFLFGGLAEAGSVLLDPVRLSFEDNLLGVYRGNVDIRLSGLAGSDAAILGAASLIWDGEPR
jgi:glucokinase